MDDPHERRGTHETADPDFARGQDSPDEPEEEHRGDFAEGQASTHIGVDTPRGDFAEGQEQEPHDRGPVHHRGDFAEGQELEQDQEHDRDLDPDD